MKPIQKIKYNNRSYIWDGNKNDFSMLSIEENQNVIFPENFTKYYSLSKYSIESTINNYIYASHPYELNDPFDCFSYLIDTSEITDNDIKFIESRLNLSVNKDKVNEDPEKFIDILYSIIFEGCGIISLTDSKNENPSLWANYTNKHKGFSITYKNDSFNEIALGPFRVDYVNKLEKLKYDSKNFNPLILYLTTIKSDYWSNEQEWRFIGFGKDRMYIPYQDFGLEKESKKQNRKLYLPKNSIVEIKLGFYFFDVSNLKKNNLNEIIVDLNKESNSELKIKLLSFIKSQNIPLQIIFLDKLEFKCRAINVEYDFFPETNLFKYKKPNY